MKQLLVVVAFAAVALTGATRADATVIKSNWNERVDYTGARGFVRLYVRRIVITPTSWKAWVGLTNNAPRAVGLSARIAKPIETFALVYWAGPGIWWSSYVKGTSWWPGSGTVVTHSARGGVSGRYPTKLGARKSWFGTFSGSTSKLPRGRLLRIGFGILDLGPSAATDANGTPLHRELVLSTTHQFKLPRRIR